MSGASVYALEPIRIGADFTLSRARERGNPMRLLTVAPSVEHPPPESVGRLAHEYSLAADLEPAWAAKPLALARHDGRTLLVLIDPGGEPLDRVLARKHDQPFDLARLLSIAVNLASVLGQVHRRGLIHKDLKPENVLVDEAGNVWLLGFGIASRLPRERHGSAPPQRISGTLAYMSPEQTGRMNRSIDYRSDLYSLGVTLYEMLTGRLPFAATHTLEWVHCHIARQPEPPSGQGLQEPLSAIVMKLLSKNAEERYQTAAALEADLRRCQSEWISRRRIDPFPLGARDVPDRLLIPEKLYGREREVEALLGAFNRVLAGGRPELVLVSGHSGIGKSMVVNELHRALVPARGRFASGKFDQYQRNIPHATVAQAFESLVHPLLSLPESEVHRWRGDLLRALGSNGALVLDLVPELQRIIGEQPPVVSLPPQEAKARSHLAFRSFIGAFIGDGRPLTLFLDDLQWLDAATLDFLEALLVHQDRVPLLVIGAYRDNEVDPTHPLMRTLSAIRDAGAAIHELRLGALSVGDLARLVADAFHCGLQRATPLARLLHAKTGGNPFFSVQFIQDLVEEGVVVFDPVRPGWNWELDDVRAQSHTDNVVDLMVGKLARLPATTRDAIQQLACVGNRTDATTLSWVVERSEAETDAVMRPAIHQELVIRSEHLFSFAHDRVQEAAYSLMADEMRAESHLRIGRLLVRHTPDNEVEESVFEIVGQLNRGADLIRSADERKQVALLNLRAARRAKAATAYSSALAHLRNGEHLLTEAGGESDHEIAFAIQSLMAECELLTADMGAAETRLGMLAATALTARQRATIARLQITLYTALDRSEVCVDVFLEFLRRGGTVWARHPTRDDVLREHARIGSFLRDRPVEELLQLPPMTDPAVIDALDVFTEIVHPALFYDENLSSLVVCRMVSLSLEHGNCDASCFAYVWFGMLCGPRFDRYRDGFRFGQLGFDLVESQRLFRYQARTYLTFATLTPWTRHYSQARGLIQRGLAAAHRNGDLTYSAYSGKISITNHLLAGDPLPDLHAEAEEACAFAGRSGFGLMVTICGTQRALIRTLCGLTPKFGCLDDGEFEEDGTERRLAGNPLMSLAEFFYWTRKMQARFLAGELAEAVAASGKAQRLLWTATSQVTSAELPFYAALAHAASWDAAPPHQRHRHFESLTAQHRQLEIWSRYCPANFENCAALVAAEIARIDGRDADAGPLYELAIRSARDNGFVHHEAIANEVTARYCFGRGLETAGYAHLRHARNCYDRWGAKGKVDQLDRSYPRLREQQPASLATIGPPATQLDLETVVKASQALSSEIALHGLIEKLVQIAVEHAGAERALLILVRQGDPRIEAQAVSLPGKVDVVVRQSPVTSTDLPASALHYVMRMRECVLLDDASADETYSNDEYVRARHSRSILCLPILKQSTLIGVLYLENALTPGAFTPDRLTVLQLLASQAAISLENAVLYADLQLQAGLLQSLPVSAWTLKTDGTPDFVNQVWLDYSGQTREFVRSHPEAWMTAVHPDDREAASRTFWNGVRSEQGFAIEARSLRSRDGTYRWHLNQAVLLRDEEGRVLKFVGTSTDIDDQKRAEDALRQAQGDLTRIHRVTTMGEVAASLAHEVSQPISGAMTNADLCLRRLGSEAPDMQEIAAAVTRIVRDTQRAAQIIERIRSQFRKSAPRQQVLDLGDAVREIVGLLQGEAVRNHITLLTELDADLPRAVGDRVQLQQVAMNLLVNSIEAMSGVDGERTIVIRACRAEEEDRILVSVHDTGIGLPAHVAEQIFQPFFTTKAQGTGMGLRISRSIIESHGGRLWATPNDGPGATFSFLVPGAPPSAEDVDQPH